MLRRIPPALGIALLLAWPLYLYHLDAAGLIGPDEPRYASISREMAWSGDWVTPYLWGQPWFEKSPLLYWMDSTAFRLGLGPEIAPRLPVALLSLAFLAFYWWILWREFGCLAAWFALVILGTSVGWIAYSQAGVTDLPLAATFSAAMLLALPWIAKGETKFLPAAAVLLGLATLAKYQVGLVLAIPLFVLNWRRFRDLLRPRVVLVFLAVAAPWYILCYSRNGRPFLQTMWDQQFGRFTSAALMHPQPWWFYLPVLLAVLAPWSPLLPLAARRSLYQEPRRVFLLVWVLFGLVFFSLGVNKLWGYLLPLLPAAAAVLALALLEARRAGPWLAACALMLVTVPIAAPLAPKLDAGLSRIPFPTFHWTWLAPVGVAAIAWALESSGRRLAAILSIAIGATVGTAYLKQEALPEWERNSGSRTLWSEVAPHASETCVEGIHRNWRYGLNYYAVTPLPECTAQWQGLRLRQGPEAGQTSRPSLGRPGDLPHRVK